MRWLPRRTRLSRRESRTTRHDAHHRGHRRAGHVHRVRRLFGRNDGAIPLTLGRRGLYLGIARRRRRGRVGVAAASVRSPTTRSTRTPRGTDGAGNELPSDPRLGHHGRFFVGRHRSDDYPDRQQFWRPHLVAARSAARTGPRRRRHPRRPHRRERRTVPVHDLPGSGIGDRAAQVPVLPDDVEGRLEHGTARTAAIRARRRSLLHQGRPAAVPGRRITRASIRYFVGLVCGHMKTRFFAESLAWQVGIAPHELAAVDFRIKNPDRKASDYDFGALRSGANDYVQRRTQALVGGNWGHGAFNPRRATSATTSSPKPQTSCSATRGCRATRTIGGARTSS